MTLEFLSGNRLQGTAHDKRNLPFGTGGWKELGRTTLGSSNENVDVTGLANKRYLMILRHGISNSGEYQTVTRVGNASIDTGNNYAHRSSDNGGADGTATSLSYMVDSGFTGLNDKFEVGYIVNYSTKEKLYYNWECNRNTAGAGTAPSRKESTGKWVNTSDVIDQFRWAENGTGTHNTGSEVVVLGYDPADTHTTNFWEQLANVNAGGSSQNLSTGVFTAKKYLWVQTYCKGQTADVNMTFNNDGGANYARRYSSNGGADLTNATQTSLSNMPTNGATTPSFCNFFIINNSANEKLLFGHVISQNTAGAGTAPTRLEWACKWVNTTSQITEIDLDSVTTNFSSDSMIRVWGAN
mgnify:FL=1